MKYDEFLKQQEKIKKRHIPRHIESSIQKQLVTWFRYHYPQYIIAAIPNGGFRNAREAKYMKEEGVLAGFSDLIMIAKGSVLFVEVKTPEGMQSEKQKIFQAKIDNLGFRYCICHSLKEFIVITKKWIERDCKV